jgi:hypothetical protein
MQRVRAKILGATLKTDMEADFLFQDEPRIGFQPDYSFGRHSIRDTKRNRLAVARKLKAIAVKLEKSVKKG